MVAGEILTNQLKKVTRSRAASRWMFYRICILLVLITATWVFGAITEDVVTHDPLTITDVRFSVWLHTHASASLTRLMLLISFVHSGLCVTVLTLAVSVYL